MARCIEEKTNAIVDSNPPPEQMAAEGCALLDDAGVLLDRYGD